MTKLYKWFLCFTQSRRRDLDGHAQFNKNQVLKLEISKKQNNYNQISFLALNSKTYIETKERHLYPITPLSSINL